jgi:hypothetical protein
MVTIHENDTAIMERQTIASMCLAYQDIKHDLTEAFNLLDKAEKRGTVAFERSGMPWLKADLEECLKGVTRQAWYYIIRQTHILEMCSIKQAKEIEEQMEHNELPEITEESVWAFIQARQSDLPAMVQQAVKEVYQILTPGARCGSWVREKWKTNQTSIEVAPKLILPGFIDTAYGSWHISYYCEQEIRAIDNIFHLLDGKGVAKYPEDLYTVLNGALQKGIQECETPYFRCKAFKSRTLHINIKRDDLRKELNRIAGGLNLQDETVAPEGAIQVA